MFPILQLGCRGYNTLLQSDIVYWDCASFTTAIQIPELTLLTDKNVLTIPLHLFILVFSIIWPSFDELLIPWSIENEYKQSLFK